MTDRTTILGLLGVFGGAVVALSPVLHGRVPWHGTIATVGPLLLIAGTVGLYGRYGPLLSRLDIGVLAVGLGVLSGAALLDVSFESANFAAVFVIDGVASVGMFLTWVGSLRIASRLVNAARVSFWTAVLLAIAVPLDVIAILILVRIIGPLPSVYGLAWIWLGYRVYQPRQH